jgi:hypothetical protein
LTRETVRLVGVTLRTQGAHDSLCAYYAAAMLLCALEPALEDEFEAPTVAQDPLFGNLPRRRGERLEALVAEWIASGVRLERLCRAMNAAAAPTRFRYAAGARGLAGLTAAVDAGLPTLLAWESREMGDHTVVVIGYDRYANGRIWLRLLDPIRAAEVMELDQIRRLADRVELIAPVAHAGRRPDKLTTLRNSRKRSTRIDRWDPSARGWSAL